MIVVTTRHIAGDTRQFCAEWYAMPSYKFDPAILKINQYAYPDNDVPEDFYKKHCIYYVDTDNQNRLVKAYELEDKWDQMTWVEGDTLIGINGDANTDVYTHYLINALNELVKRIEALEKRLDAFDLSPLEYRIAELSKLAVQIGDSVDIELRNKE